MVMRASEYERIVDDLKTLAERLRETAEEEGSQRVYDMADELSGLLHELGRLS